MIRLSKLDEPKVLRKNKASWTKQLLELKASGENVPASLASKYRLPEVKRVIVEEASGKCAYCESAVDHVYFGDVEHLLPKSEKPELTFEWSNLGYACSICNGNKSSYFDPKLSLVNPYAENPSDHIRFYGFFMFNAPESRRGQMTIEQIELNRAELVERRKERLEQVKRMCDLWARESNARLRSVLWGEIEREMAEDREFAFMVSTFLKAHVPVNSEQEHGDSNSEGD